MVTITVENQTFKYAKADAQSLRLSALTTYTTGIPRRSAGGKFQIYAFKHPISGIPMYGVERVDSSSKVLCLTKNGMKEFIYSI